MAPAREHFVEMRALSAAAEPACREKTYVDHHDQMREKRARAHV